MVPEHDDAVLDGVIRLGNGAGVAVVIAVADRHSHIGWLGAGEGGPAPSRLFRRVRGPFRGTCLYLRRWFRLIRVAPWDARNNAGELVVNARPSSGTGRLA